MFLSTSDRKTLRVPSTHARRPPIKRTASTASLNEVADLNLPPDQQAIIRSADLSSDEEVNEMQDDDLHEGVDKDPFVVTPPPGSGSGMLIDTTPTASPTLPRSHYNSKAIPRRASARARSDSEEERDDAANNPFLASAKKSHPPREQQRKKASKTDPGRQKVSYVFRGKRITYDAPLESLFPVSDDDADCAHLANMKSGPRVLFPAPPTPVSKKSEQSPAKASSPSAFTVNQPRMELLQTPRRGPTTTNPAFQPVAAGLSHQPMMDGNKGESKPGGRADERAIPPTPASLPQKSKAQRQLERERLHGAMRGLHHGPGISHQMAGAGGGPKRYAPYPPR